MQCFSCNTLIKHHREVTACNAGWLHSRVRECLDDLLQARDTCYVLQYVLELNPTCNELTMLASGLMGRRHLLDHEHRRGPVSSLIVALVQARNALKHCSYHDAHPVHTCIASASAVSDYCWVGPPRGLQVCSLLILHAARTLQPTSSKPGKSSAESS